MDESTATSAFSALGHDGRLSALRLLIGAGPEGMAAGDIAEALDMRRNTLSSNLAILTGTGLISSKRDGRSVRYSVDLERVRALVAFLLEDCCGGQPDQCRPLLDEIGGAAAPQDRPDRTQPI